MRKKVVYSVVVPVYNEELVIYESYTRLTKVMETTLESYEIIFVNDGSRDMTRRLAEDISKRDGRVNLINFSRNFGHQAAITAGMANALGEAIVVIDADLQDPPEVITEMIIKWKEGYDVVYGKRSEREGETFIKKFTAAAYYKLLRKITNIDIPVNTGDFRLIDRKVCDALTALPEHNRYVRGLVSWVGFKQTSVEFVRKERFAGVTKYPFKKMIKLAFDGITSFSYKPLTIANYFGIFSIMAGTITLFINLISNIIRSSSILDLGMVLSINLIMFGLLFCCVGFMGQYVGRVLDECKDRPEYIIESTINSKGDDMKYEIVK
jgi:polyisoprenyl-phosphate glycosyltransferase